MIVFAEAGVVLLHEDGFPLHSHDRGREHGHRVGVTGHGPEDVEYILRDARAVLELLGDFRHL
jgi:hypothetical protein